MPKISVDYKTVERDGAAIVTKQMKQVFEEFGAQHVSALAQVLQSPGLEYLTVRRVKDKIVKPKVEVKR